MSEPIHVMTPEQLFERIRPNIDQRAHHVGTNLVTPVAADVQRLGITVDKLEKKINGNGTHGIDTKIALMEGRVTTLEQSTEDRQAAIISRLDKLSEAPEKSKGWDAKTIAIIVAAVIGSGGVSLGASRAMGDTTDQAAVAEKLIERLDRIERVSRRRAEQEPAAE